MARHLCMSFVLLPCTIIVLNHNWAVALPYYSANALFGPLPIAAVMHQGLQYREVNTASTRPASSACTPAADPADKRAASAVATHVTSAVSTRASGAPSTQTASARAHYLHVPQALKLRVLRVLKLQVLPAHELRVLRADELQRTHDACRSYLNVQTCYLSCSSALVRVTRVVAMYYYSAKYVTRAMHVPCTCRG